MDLAEPEQPRHLVCHEVQSITLLNINRLIVGNKKTYYNGRAVNLKRKNNFLQIQWFPSINYYDLVQDKHTLFLFLFFLLSFFSNKLKL